MSEMVMLWQPEQTGRQLASFNNAEDPRLFLSDRFPTNVLTRRAVARDYWSVDLGRIHRTSRERLFFPTSHTRVRC